jgi:hypothetical protein
MRAAILLAITLTAGAAPWLTAQDTEVVPIGTRVRISGRHLRFGHLVGTVTRENAETLVVGSRAVAFRDLRKLEISTGRRSRLLVGMGNGFLGGAIFGAAFAAVVLDGTMFCADTGTCILRSAGIVGGAGAVTGLLIGAISRGDQWRKVPTDRWRITALPRSTDGMAFAVTVSF